MLLRSLGLYACMRSFPNRQRMWHTNITPTMATRMHTMTYSRPSRLKSAEWTILRLHSSRWECRRRLHLGKQSKICDDVLTRL